MDTILSAVRLLHIAAGALALVAGAVPLLSRKGSHTHKRWGRVYTIAMTVVLITAVLTAIVYTLSFLFLVALFSSYLLGTGYRSLRRKRTTQTASGIDIAIGGIAVVVGAVLAFTGVWALARGTMFGVVSLGFGALMMFFAITDLVALRKPARLHQWFFAHMTRMTASYIATVTAFLVTNGGALPMLLRWVLPTLFGSLALTLWNRYYRKKFGRPADARPIETVPQVEARQPVG